MKVKVEEDKNFEPVTISITMETKEDLVEMWLRLNLALPKVLKEMNPPVTSIFGPDITPALGGSFEVWGVLDDLAKGRGLKRM